ncbi:LOW QUALITY PROTEIN: neuropeptide S receptor-like [Pecten maximus]|uniref:LOW QUALITY PROTEIN: neuropeptide S receptor-like n=1 Tax=Pecten maximus TaxID=6579 RepID=UPI001457F462|nr:LOW QUALITY PROTEIN: neuropeptide S receptor-like [Pecten maximus]
MQNTTPFGSVDDITNANTYTNTSSLTSSATSSSNITGNVSEYGYLEDTVISSGPEIDSINQKYFSSVLLLSFIYACVLLVVGIPGNSLVVYVYGFKSKRTVSRTFILTLAALDLINCSFSISTELFLLWNFFKFDYPEHCKISRFITSFCNHSTTVVLLTIAIDRFRKIRYPLKRTMRKSTALKVIFFAMIFGCLTGIPFALLYGTHTVPLGSDEKDAHKTVYQGKTCLPQDGVDIVYKELLLIVLSVAHVVSDIILVVLYSCVGKTVLSSHNSFGHDDTTIVNRHSERRGSYELGRRNTSRLNSTSSVPGKFSHTNTMLFLVTLVFIVSFVPYLVLAFLRTFQMKTKQPSSLSAAVQHFFLRSYFLNSAINPIVYCFVSKHFRQEAITGIRRMFSRRRTWYDPRRPTQRH